MIRTSQKLSPVMIGLILMVGPTVIAQEVGSTDADPAAVDQATAAPEVGASESTASEADTARCPRCGRERGLRGQETDDAEGERGCRCGQGGCRRGRGRGPGNGDGNGPKNGFGKAGPGTVRGPGARQGAGQGAGRQGRGKQAGMVAYRTLLENHESITRTFENIPGGIRSVTTSSDPEIAQVLRLHVGQVTDLLENGGWIRIWDPLFAEIFEHADKIETSVEKIEGGLVVIETSQNEQVALLIQAHAAKVMEFVERGQEAYDEPTPLPDGYEAPSD